ncbi:type II secretion system major pseudopilin GspG [Aquella oligotrophica]|uniref:Type II secretion system core protein G n=1 Tax=Aquella oligotrophica TaxID=2067065 RepID=A0A2I7N7A5_9NEIS|nr:type II secretion system major pseudopilin GspG [Aquella oligotrophica]AUR52331.1 type II secretion system protein GspG [Aquella oligotrophica]
MQKKRQGFTLIEIMVVIVIMGIMAALVVPRVMGSTDQARTAAAKADIQSVMTALKLYKLDNIRYPTQQQGLDALVNKPSVAPIPNNYKAGGYLEKLPKDPWGNDYQYQNPGKHGEVDVFSYGPDGATSSGTDGQAVIGSWQ